MLRDEKGIALVMVIMMTAVVMMIVSLVGFKVLRSTKGSAIEGLKTKTYEAANSGLENARVYLSDNYISQNNWQYVLDPDTAPGYSGSPTNPQADLYQHSTLLEPAGFVTDPPMDIKVYVKDNNDGDDNYGIDTDQLIMVNVEATAPDGRTTTLVEARLLYDDSIDSYSQLGGSAGREHYRDVSGVADPATLGDNASTLDLKQ